MRECDKALRNTEQTITDLPISERRCTIDPDKQQTEKTKLHLPKPNKQTDKHRPTYEFDLELTARRAKRELECRERDSNVGVGRVPTLLLIDRPRAVDDERQRRR